MVRIFQPEPVMHSSLGLQSLCQRLQNVDACDILELGPVREGNIQFWSRFHPYIYVADLRSSLPFPPLPSDDLEIVYPEWDRLLELPAGRAYDVILAWDLLNYLELPVIASLVQYLKGFCRPGSILFALFFDRKEMPAAITVYHIADESHLRYELSGTEMCACPRHQPRAVAGVMTQFRTSNSFRLRNGVVEFLFEFE